MLSRALSLLIYLGIGAVWHIVFVGPRFDWSSAWSYAWLLAWPILLAGIVWAVFVVVSVVVAVGATAVDLLRR